MNQSFEHFNEISDYDAEIPEHMRLHYLEKKVRILRQWIDQFSPSKNPSILDVGCGTGWHLSKLADSSGRLVGVDPSTNQLQQARRLHSNIELHTGSAESLPYEADTFDVVFSINTIHHLPSKESQAQALQEIRRVLRPGGLFVIQEVNVLNPIIRLYMNHIFPRLRSIDTGDEIWLSIRDISEVFGAPLAKRYYTFAPDWTPRALLRIVQSLEWALEKTPCAWLGAHFAAAYRKA